MSMSTTLENGAPRFAERVECGSMHAADAIRRRFGDCLHEEDDARQREILLSVDAPRSVKNEIGRIAAESWPSDRFGTAELTDFERSRIDFSETNTFHAQAVKAIAIGVGVDDWLSYYHPELTVDEHRDRLRHVGGGSITMRDLPMVLGERGDE